MTTAKEYLRQVRSLGIDIKVTQMQIKELESMSEKATGTYTAERISGTPGRSKVEEAVVDRGMADLKSELRIKRFKYDRMYRERMAVIDAVQDSTYRQLLTLYYLCGKTWEKTAETMGKSDRWVRGHMHGEALKMVIVPCSSG